MRTAALALAAALALVGCDPPQDKGVIDAASPNASIQPAPLASTLEPPDAGSPQGDTSDKAAASATASGAPDAMVPEKPLDSDTPPARDVAGVVLAAAFRWRDVPPPPKAAEVNANGIQEAAKATALTWKIELADTGRMRATFTSRALPLPTFSELRARSDNWGNIVVWPSASQYRVVPPGALRTVMGERRVDVTPLAPGSLKAGAGRGQAARRRDAQGRAQLGARVGVARARQAARSERATAGRSSAAPWSSSPAVRSAGRARVCRARSRSAPCTSGRTAAASRSR